MLSRIRPPCTLAAFLPSPLGQDKTAGTWRDLPITTPLTSLHDKSTAAAGGEGVIFNTSETDPLDRKPLCAKIYETPASEPLSKHDWKDLMGRVEHLAKFRKNLLKEAPLVTWPVYGLYKTRTLIKGEPNIAQAVGHALPLYSEPHQNILYYLTIPKKAVLARNPGLDYDKFTQRLAVRLAETIAGIHRVKLGDGRIVINDLTPTNILVANPPTVDLRLIDIDTYQIGRLYRSPKYTETWHSPMIFNAQGRLRDTLREQSDDNYSLALILFNLLVGKHAWAPAPAHQDETVRGPYEAFTLKTMGLTGDWFYEKNIPNLPPNPHGKKKYDLLPHEIRAAFARTFVERKPVPAQEWATLIRVHLLKEPPPIPPAPPRKEMTFDEQLAALKQATAEARAKQKKGRMNRVIVKWRKLFEDAFFRFLDPDTYVPSEKTKHSIAEHTKAVIFALGLAALYALATQKGKTP